MDAPHRNKKDQFSFIQGPIQPHHITEEIRIHQPELQTGAYSLFLGQVRNDEINGKKVTAIEYSAYDDMVLKKFINVAQSLRKNFEINKISILHSLKKVSAGDFSLLVIVTSGHRVAAMEACREAVNLIKSELPIWGKELFEDGGHVWKKND